MPTAMGSPAGRDHRDSSAGAPFRPDPAPRCAPGAATLHPECRRQPEGQKLRAPSSNARVRSAMLSRSSSTKGGAYVKHDGIDMTDGTLFARLPAAMCWSAPAR